MPFLTIDLEVCRHGRAWFLLSIIVEKIETKVSNARRGCSSREF
jgi:hypothetical protein